MQRLFKSDFLRTDRKRTLRQQVRNQEGRKIVTVLISRTSEGFQSERRNGHEGRVPDSSSRRSQLTNNPFKDFRTENIKKVQ